MIETSVDFHSALYPQAALERAVAAYAEVAEVTLEPIGERVRVTLRGRGALPADVLRHEFANFVLAACALDAPLA